MQVSKITFDKIKSLSEKDTTYQLSTHRFASYISFEPSLSSFSKAIEDRSKKPIDRSLIVSVLESRYKEIVTNAQKANIASLADEKTFTIVTAHQPILLGGPAYYIYKICSVINLCKQLKTLHPDCHFVPTFVSGAEDHDFDEVKSINLFSKTITWTTDQSGPVGRFSLDGVAEALENFKSIIGAQPNAAKIVHIFENALSKSKSYSEFVFQWVNDFFGSYGVIVMNMDDPQIKRRFIPIILKEIFDRPSETLVKETQEKLNNDFQFKSQAFAREINFFYLLPGKRERIIYEDGIYKINNTELHFTESELRVEIEAHPENFSPNVVMRPLFQEYILPNLAYIGGGGEIAYWLERKSQFDHFGVFYPMLIRRNSLMVLSKSIQKSIQKLNLSEEDILLEEGELIRTFASRSAGKNADIAEELSSVEQTFHSLATKAKSVDPTLEGMVLAEAAKSIKSIQAIEARLIKSLKSREEVSIQQISSLKSKLFPGGGLQERSDSFWSLYANENEDFLDQIIDICDPMQKEFLFIYL